MVQRAERARYSAVVLTLDPHSPGRRSRRNRIPWRRFNCGALGFRIRRSPRRISGVCGCTRAFRSCLIVGFGVGRIFLRRRRWAHAVLLGRLYMWGPAVAGEEGVRDLLLNLVADLDLTLALSGCTCCRELGSSALCKSDSAQLLRRLFFCSWARGEQRCCALQRNALRPVGTQIEAL